MSLRPPPSDVRQLASGRDRPYSSHQFRPAALSGSFGVGHSGSAEVGASVHVADHRSPRRLRHT